MKRIDSSAYQVPCQRVTRHGSDSILAPVESPELFIFGRWNMANKKMADIFKTPPIIRRDVGFETIKSPFPGEMDEYG